MNRVILMGRLTRDPEVRYTQGERSMAVARYTLAVTPTKKVSVFIPQISSQMIRNLLIVKMRPLEENRHQKWESRSVMALCQYRMA